MNGKLLKLFHGTQRVELQIACGIGLFRKLPCMIEAVSDETLEGKFLRKMVSNKSSSSNYLDFGNGFQGLGKPYSLQLSDIQNARTEGFLGVCGVMSRIERSYENCEIYDNSQDHWQSLCNLFRGLGRPIESYDNWKNYEIYENCKI